MNEPTIQLINHASVLLSDGEVSLLTDPWYTGSAFHYGWSLLHENVDSSVESLLDAIQYIWISHEHPDHFSVPFFARYGAKLAGRGVKVLFQKTGDGRVAGFLRGRGLQVIELANGQELELGKRFSVQVQKSDFYDSALIARLGGKKIFNLNDCPLRTDSEIKRFKRRYGACDLLLTQFSYAAWKGGRANREWRQAAAREKLEHLSLQHRILEAKEVVPFASFIYFSNALNSYLNDSVNAPSRVLSFCRQEGIHAVFLAPNERQAIGRLVQKPESLEFWDGKFEQACSDRLPLVQYAESAPIERLEGSFREYRRRLLESNSAALIRALKSLPLIHAFEPVRVLAIDLGRVFRVDLANGLFEPQSGDLHDIAMHSQSLLFIFDNLFGFDTLTVNGCFESSADGFKRAAKHLSLGNLNTLGIFLNFGLPFRTNVIGLFLNKLARASRRMPKAKVGPSPL